MKIRALLLILFFLTIASGASAGWIFVENSEGDRQTKYLQDNKMKFVAPDHIMIFDLDKNRIVFANPKEKNYWLGAPENFAAQARENIRNMDKMLEKQLAQVPVAQRENFKRAIVQQIKKQYNRQPPVLEVRSTDQSDKIAGYKVRKYEVLFNGQVRQEQWIAEDIRVNHDLNVERFGKMMRAFHAGSGRGSEDAALSSPRVTDLMKKGWPLRIVDYDEDGYPETDEVIRVEKKSLPSSTFDFIKKYRKMSMTELFGGR
ncbi:DUF4412 domain-containing protein [Desulfococcaceae bacterium HSG8]|nr:DUF4412 domain-containing protein [Desulfococcaceae bacterium HSG8]